MLATLKGVWPPRPQAYKALTGVTSNENFLRIEKYAIPIPMTVFPFPFPSTAQTYFHSHGNPIPTGIPIPIHSSTSDIPLRTIKLFSVLFSGVSGHAAGRDKQTFTGASPTVRSRPTLHGPRQLFLLLCSSHVQQLIDSQWCMADCVIYTASSSVNVFGNGARPAIFDSQLLHQNRDLCLYPTCI